MLKVKAECCNQCLFSKDRIVSPKRANEVIKDCIKNDSHFICHKASIQGKDVCCKGFYNTVDTSLVRVAKRLNCVEFVN